MERPAVLQPIIDLFKSARYLEIGVSQGATFNALNARTKIAVDPRFQFAFQDISEADKEIFYHQCTSDDFFANYGLGKQFDVIYIDGMHTFEQTLRDLLNAVTLLRSNGIIVIDDVLPDNYPASLREEDCLAVRRLTGEAGGSWMGDVFKLVFFIQSFMQQFGYRCISDNHGQLVMWRQVRGKSDIPNRGLAEISVYSYADSVLKRDAFKLETHANIMSLLRSSMIGSIRQPGG
ncbi:MAG: class I SAM-dependent methyltransferase [Beijerinckiaceae bacterium]